MHLSARSLRQQLSSMCLIRVNGVILYFGEVMQIMGVDLPLMDTVSMSVRLEGDSNKT